MNLFNLTEIPKHFPTSPYVALATEDATFAVINIRKNPDRVPQLVKEAICEHLNDYEMDEIAFDSRLRLIDVRWGIVAQTIVAYPVWMYE